MKFWIWVGVFAAALVLIVAVLALPSSPSPGDTAYAEEAAVVADYTAADCDVLQVRFDGWYRNRGDFPVMVASSMMDADDDRMRELGCFG